MKTIAELKAEIKGTKGNPRTAVYCYGLKCELRVLQSLSQRITESVEKCDYCVSYPEKIEGKFCKDLPLNLKCPGCKRLLRLKKEMEG